MDEADELTPSVRQLIAALGPRPRQERIREAILRLTETPRSPATIARLLGLRDVGKLVERHLAPMTREGSLIRTHPDTPAHPQQAYRAAQPRLAGRSPEGDDDDR
ncbi:MAG: hypothetical protein HYV09_05735 [Deltaproteobacteria bacterium]|nr:hypothetical protein [Deltaproteobacteria bacterium]